MTSPFTSIPSAHAVLSVAEMYAADKAAEAAGIASLDLMEAAGGAIMRLVLERWTKQQVVVLCGPGNNGGDGFVVARLLMKAGWSVRLALLGHTGELRGDAAANAARWRDTGGDVLPLGPDVLEGRPLVIDAIFGAGLSRGLTGAARAVVERINAEGLICVGVDVPSGVQGDTGLILPDGDRDGVAPQCAATVTFFRPKPAHLLYPGRALCGDLNVADIGIPDSVLEKIAPRTARNAPGLWTLPVPHWSDHKYTRGHGVVIGGGTVTGAARLAARAARRAGSGLLTIGSPALAAQIYAFGEPGAFVYPLDSVQDLDSLLVDKRKNGVLIGPGCGVGTATAMYVMRILASERPVVLDADALTSFQDDPDSLFAAIRRRSAAVVLTPHAGEFRRLFKAEGGKLEQARHAAALSGAVVVFKGPDTVIATPDGLAAVATNAPPWLATGGSGDVLAGFILGLLVQGLDAFAAACAAVWLHGEAGTLAGRGLIAEDLPEALSKVLKSL
jgi:hydroxyethylthiazole kinase-like uncharacterized protein yjeF